MPPSTAELEDYWKILGLAAGATKEEVRKAYRKRSLAVHPDRYKGDDPEGATAEFLRLTRAKEVLDDDKARAAFENVVKARAMHKEKQAAQDGVRKKMREDLEAREAEARKRQRTGPSAEAQQQAQQQASTEADARRELERELERLWRTGRLGGTATAPAPADDASATGSGGASSTVTAPRPVAANAKAIATLRWSADKPPPSEAEVRQLLSEHGAPADTLVALVGVKAVCELEPHCARAFSQRSSELAARGVRLSVQQPAGTGRDDGVGAVAGGSNGAAAVINGASLPTGWKEQLAPDGQVYYYHMATRQTQWTRPTAEQAAAPAAQATVSASEHDRDESLTMMRLKQASERQRLATREANV